MTVTKAQLTTEISTLWPDNVVGSITPANARVTLNDMTTAIFQETVTLAGDVTGTGSDSGGTGTNAFTTTLSAGNAGNLNSGTLLAARMPALTGDVTSTVGTVSTTIANNAVTSAKIADGAVSTTEIADNSVTNAKLAQATSNTIKGNPTGATANITDTVAPVLGNNGGASGSIKFNGSTSGSITFAAQAAGPGVFDNVISVAPASGAASVNLAPQAATSQSLVNFLQTSTTKWQLGKQTDDTFILFDNAAGKNILSCTTGAPGVTGLINNTVTISSGQTSAVNPLLISDAVAGNTVRAVVNNTSTANSSVAGLEVVTGVASAFGLLDLNNQVANPALNFGWGAGVTAGLNINNNGTTVLLLNNGFQPPGPASKTISFTPALGDYSYVCSGAGTITITLPTTIGHLGRIFHIKTVTAQTVVSNASNVVPLAGGAATTAILAATAGKWAIIQFDGTNYHIMAAN